MMVEANGEKVAADISTGKHCSCGHSLGLQELIKLRNEAQVKALSEADGKTCTLFKATSRPAKKPRVSHAQMKNLRDCLLYTSPSPRDRTRTRKPSSA